MRVEALNVGGESHVGIVSEVLDAIGPNAGEDAAQTIVGRRRAHASRPSPAEAKTIDGYAGEIGVPAGPERRPGLVGDRLYQPGHCGSNAIGAYYPPGALDAVSVRRHVAADNPLHGIIFPVQPRDLIPRGVSTTRILVLGVLRDETMHGYELKATLERWGAPQWAGVSSGSIYFALKKMAKEGLVEVRGAEPGDAGGEHVLYAIKRRRATRVRRTGPGAVVELSAHSGPLDGRHDLRR